MVFHCPLLKCTGLLPIQHGRLFRADSFCISRRAFHEGHLYIARKRFARHRAIASVTWDPASPKKLTCSIWSIHRWRDHPEYPFNDEYWKQSVLKQVPNSVPLGFTERDPTFGALTLWETVQISIKNMTFTSSCLVSLLLLLKSKSI